MIPAQLSVISASEWGSLQVSCEVFSDLFTCLQTEIPWNLLPVLGSLETLVIIKRLYFIYHRTAFKQLGACEHFAGTAALNLHLLSSSLQKK